MDPVTNSAFNTRRRSIDDTFNAGRAQNTFDRANFARQSTRNISDFRSGFARQTPKFQAHFANRGLGQSGIYRRALRNFTGDYSRDLGRMYEDDSAGRYQFDLNDAMMKSQYDGQIADLDLQKAQQIAATAKHINALKPYMS
jgi:hypothetical protein